MIVKKEFIPGTSRARCTFDSGTVLESQLVFLTEEQWKSLRILAALHNARVSAVIGRLIDNAAMAAREL
jgi:hypothetical protein